MSLEHTVRLHVTLQVQAVQIILQETDMDRIDKDLKRSSCNCLWRENVGYNWVLLIVIHMKRLLYMKLWTYVCSLNKQS